MKSNKDFAPKVLVLIIIAFLAVGCIAYYLGKNSNSIPAPEQDKSGSISAGLKKAYSNYKNGQINECVYEGKLYYTASSNVYDGNGETFDIDGNIVGNHGGFSPTLEGINPQQCERIYVVEKNIWGYPAVNKYNLQ